MHYSDGKLIYIRDLLAEMLKSWKRVLIVTIILTLLCAGGGALLALRSSGEQDTAGAAGEETAGLEVVNAAKNSLSAAEAVEVERAYEQLSSYLEYRRIWQEDFASYIETYDEKGESPVVKRVTYTLETSMEGASNLFSSLSMGDEEYKKIVEILPEVDSITAAYNYVTISTVAGNFMQITNMGENSPVMPLKYLINVEVVGNSKEVCDRMDDVVNQAFEKEMNILHNIDKEARLDKIGFLYNANVREYIAKKQQTAFESIQKIDSSIITLNNYVAKLNEDQIVYFNLLSESRGQMSEEADAVPQAKEKKTGLIRPKFIILGIALGIICGYIWVLLRYLLSGRINTGEEVEHYYRIPVLNTFFVPGGSLAPFTGVIRNLYRADTVPPEKKAEITGIDLAGMLRESEGNSVYLVQTFQNDRDNMVAEEVRKAVSAQLPESSLYSGLPLLKTEELKTLMEQKNAILVIHNGQTRQTDVENLLGFCSRHDVCVLGAVAVVEIG